ncbi:MAG: ADOP family duplicated permease, partial [Gemmatimonadaceae bacterium]
SIAQDLRFVVRSLRRSPIFTATVVITMALGLGANAAIFSVLDRLYVQTPAGMSGTEHVRRIYQHRKTTRQEYIRAQFSYPALRELRAIAPAGIDIASFSSDRSRLGNTMDASEIGVTYTEGNYFSVAGVHASLGRLFSDEERRVDGTTMVAVLSHDLWMRKFGGDSSVIGREIDLGSHRHIVIGVASENFRGTELNATDVFVPLNTQGTLRDRKVDWYDRNDLIFLRPLARLHDESGVSVFNSRATQALRQTSQYPDSTSNTYFAPLIEARAGEDNKQEVAISTRLTGVAAVILLIACANVINLLLARAAGRRREIALRLALGISRQRLLGQLLVESTVLAAISAVAALAVAWPSATMLRNLLLPNVHWAGAAIDFRVALFTAMLALIAGFVAGLVPALQATKPELSSALKSSVRDGGQRSSALRSSLIIAQAALSVVLLAGAGLFVRSLNGVEAIDIGYEANRLVYATPLYDQELGNRRTAIQEGLPLALERIRKLPGVESVALSRFIPMGGMSWTDIFLPGRDSLPPANGVERIMSAVSPEFFTTVGMKVLRGRAFTEADRPGGELVIAMNELMAKNLWPGEDPLTKCVIVHQRTDPCRRVVAIVSQAHFNAVIEVPSMLYYLPLGQSGKDGTAGGANAIVVRTAPGKSAAIGATVSTELVASLGPWARATSKTMEEVVAPQLRPWRVGAKLFTAAGLLALLVAAIGVYSSIAYTISQRTREMGVRVALGASSANIVRLVVTEGVRVVAVGVLLGLMIALALGSLVASLLYETSPRDPVVLFVSVATLLIVAAAACSIPAWRAARVDPLRALAAE